ncbi:MAG TPA: flagellin [Bryobacteraceae bacterium]
MLTTLNPSSELFLADVERTQRRVENASRQISSGKRITEASDAPDQVAPLLQLRAQQRLNTQIQANLALAKTDADTAEAALNSAGKLMDEALSVATGAANFTESAAGRQTLTVQIESLQQQMIAFSRTAVAGRYVFGADQDTTPPYDVDFTQEGGVVKLSDAQATRMVADPAGGSFSTSMSAHQIFDTRTTVTTTDPDGNPVTEDVPAADNVFSALDNLRLGLLNNDVAAIQASTVSIKSASNRLNAAQAFYGNVQNRIDSAISFAQNYGNRLQSEIGQKEDADVTAAAIELSQGNLQIQASLQMQANLPRSTLFDFLG